MSRFSWLKTTDAAAICGFSSAQARRVVSSLDPHHWSHRHAQVQASKLAAWFEEKGRPLPPLLLALLNDEREYPTWLGELRREYIYARRAGLIPKDIGRAPRVAAARTHEEARAIFEALPEIEARGYLDDGLPPEYRMDDKLGLARGDEDDG